MEEKITLDKKAFKALASDTRIGILKSLNVRRKTLSEISKQFDMSVSTIKEHLDNLDRAGLVVQIDDGHKWKYYELTKKGVAIFESHDTRVWVILVVSSFIAMSLTGFDFFRQSAFARAGKEKLLGTLMQFPEVAKEELGNVHKDLAVEGSADAVGTAQIAPFPWLHTALLLIFLFLIIIGIVKIYKRSKD